MFPLRIIEDPAADHGPSIFARENDSIDWIRRNQEERLSAG
jgi:hypothetical protein